MTEQRPLVTDDRRMIEDYLPIKAISKEASRDKSIRKWHIFDAPSVVGTAAIDGVPRSYGTLVPASQFVPENGPDNKEQSLGRANAANFVTGLCKYPGSPRVIAKAQEHILDAHADRGLKYCWDGPL